VVEKPDIEPRLYEAFPDIVVGPDVFQKSQRPSLGIPSASSKSSIQKLAMRPIVAQLLPNPGQIEWHHPSLGAGLSAIPECLLKTVPPANPSRRRQRRCTTTVSRSFSAKNFRGEPNAYASSRVSSTISRQDECHGKGMVRTFASVLSSGKCFFQSRVPRARNRAQ